MSIKTISPHVSEPTLDTTAWQQTAREFLRFYQIAPSAGGPLDLIYSVLQAFSNLPYENLSKIIKSRDFHDDVARLRMPDEVWEDFRRHHLGGTCFSLTFLLKAILDHLKFQTYPVMARMRSGDNRHCALVVELGGKHYLLDPGYVLELPLEIDPSRATSLRSAHGGVELVPNERPLHFELYTFKNNTRQWRYEFADAPVTAAEFFMHWIGSFQWNGMNAICLSQATRDSLLYFRQDYFRQTNAATKRSWKIKQDREKIIQQNFGVAPEIVEAAQAVIDERRQDGSRDG